MLFWTLWFLSGLISSIIFWRMNGGYLITVRSLFFGIIGILFGFVFLSFIIIIWFVIMVQSTISSGFFDKVIWKKNESKN